MYNFLPFVLLSEIDLGHYKTRVSAMEVPNGCLVIISNVTSQTVLTESVVFLPNITISNDNKLIKDTYTRI